MNDLVRHKLQEIVTRYGPTVCASKRRCQNLLRRACPGHAREIYVLVAALDAGVAKDLLALANPLPWPERSAPLVQRLVNDLAMTAEAARWAVDSWALALGKLPGSATAGTAVSPGATAVPVVPPAEAEEPAVPQASPAAPDTTGITEAEPAAGRELGGVFSRGDAAFGLVTGALYGVLYLLWLWLVGWAADRTLVFDDGWRQAYSGALAGAVVGFLRNFPRGPAASLTGAIGWALGGWLGWEVYKAAGWPAVDLRIGAVAWVGSGALTRAISQAFAGSERQTVNRVAVSGLLGAVGGLVLAGALAAALAGVLDVTRWALTAGAIAVVQGVLEEVGAGLRPALIEAGKRAVLGLLLGITIGLLDGSLTGWLLGGAVAWGLSGALTVGVERHLGAVWSVAVSPDGTRVLSGSADASLHVWDLATGRLVRRLSGARRSVWGVAWNRDGLRAAAGGAEALIRLWDIEDGTEVGTLAGHDDWVWTVAFAPNGRMLASGGADTTVRVWDVSDGAERHCLRGHQEAVESVAFSPDGRRLVSAGVDGTVRLWDVTSGREKACLKPDLGPVHAVAFSADGRQLAAGGERGVQVWNLAARRRRGHLAQEVGPVWCLAFTPDGQRLLTGDNRTVRLWDVLTGWELYGFEGHTGPVRGVAVTPDGRQVVSGSDDHTVRVWLFPQAEDAEEDEE